MTLARRIRTLERLLPPNRSGRTVPHDPVAFARGLLAGDFGPADLDPSHPDHTGWLTRVYAFRTTLLPEHQAWLTATGIRQSGCDSGEFSALDAVMRKG